MADDVGAAGGSAPPAEAPPGGHGAGRERRARPPRQARPEFRSSRHSFLSAAAIHGLDRCDRLATRRLSQAYQASADQRDLLHPMTRVTLEWRDIVHTVAPPYTLADRAGGRARPPPQPLLRSVSGLAQPGQVVALMGPSGAGKTSLLRILAGRVPCSAHGGTVLVNGAPRAADFRLVSAYVEQHSGALDSLMTAREHLEFAARLGLPRRYTPAEKRERVEHVLAILGLDSIADVVVGDMARGGISKGQRKRLSIAAELIREPKVLFLDEPTSGLDATTARTLVAHLQQLAIIDAVTVVLSVHQPRMSVLSKFDAILLLSYGQTIFWGTIDEALFFFERQGMPCPETRNPAELFLEIAAARPQQPREYARLQAMVAHWGARGGGAPPPPAGCPAARTAFAWNTPWWAEYRVLLAREYLHFHRSGARLAIVLVENVLIGCVAGFVWFQMPTDEFAGVQNRVGLLSFFQRDRTVTLAAVAATLLARDKLVAERCGSLHRVSSFYAAYMTFAYGLELVTSCIGYTCLYYIAGLRYTPFTAYLTFIGLYALVLLTAFPVGVMAACLAPDFHLAAIGSLLFWMLAFLFGGVVLNSDRITWVLRWLRYLSPTYYYCSGTCQNEFLGQTIFGQPGSFWLAQYALDDVPVVWCAGALIMINAALHTGAYMAMRHRTRAR